MTIGEKVRTSVVAQFIRPHGIWGRLVGWEMALRHSNRRRNAWAVELLEVRATDRVLEIGFGPGIAIRELSRRATRGYVCGIDHSKDMVRQARKRNRRAVRAGRVDLRLASVESVPALDGSFDRILAVNNMGMWRDPTERLKDLRSVMSSGGCIAIVSQPRCPGAREETTARAGREISEQLAQAGFAEIHSETLPLSPPVVCVLATAP